MARQAKTNLLSQKKHTAHRQAPAERQNFRLI